MYFDQIFGAQCLLLVSKSRNESDYLNVIQKYLIIGIFVDSQSAFLEFCILILESLVFLKKFNFRLLKRSRTILNHLSMIFKTFLYLLPMLMHQKSPKWKNNNVLPYPFSFGSQFQLYFNKILKIR